MITPFLEPAAAAAAIPRSGAFSRVRLPYGATRGPRSAGLARTGRGRPRVLIAALPEPRDQLLPAQEGAVPAASEADEDQGGVASAGISLPPAVTGRTVRVRFVLKEQCTFGHSFHLVGDDPALGLWEPASAVALDWSEGHDWTVEKDLPANRLIEFKFLLQDSLGKLHWQTGPNRSLQTGETTNTLVVYEDWSDEKNQKVAEEEDTPVGMVETVVADDDKSINDVVLANELQVDSDQEIKEDESSIDDDESSVVAATISVRGESVKACEADQPESSMVAATISVRGESVKACEADQPELVMDEQKIQDELCDEVHTAPQNGSATIDLQLVMDEQKIQDDLCDEVDTAPQNGSATIYADDDYGERTDDDSILSKDGVLVKNEWARARERELPWGWKALKQLLGFKMDTT